MREAIASVGASPAERRAGRVAGGDPGRTARATRRRSPSAPARGTRGSSRSAASLGGQRLEARQLPQVERGDERQLGRIGRRRRVAAEPAAPLAFLTQRDECTAGVLRALTLANVPLARVGLDMIPVENITDWRGQDVIDAVGEKLGKLEEVYFDGETDAPSFAAVKSGPAEQEPDVRAAGQRERRARYVRVDRAKGEFKKAPSFDTDVELTLDDEAATYATTASIHTAGRRCPPAWRGARPSRRQPAGTRAMRRDLLAPRGDEARSDGGQRARAISAPPRRAGPGRRASGRGRRTGTGSPESNHASSPRSGCGRAGAGVAHLATCLRGRVVRPLWASHQAAASS